jgi:hypothetical protein
MAQKLDHAPIEQRDFLDEDGAISGPWEEWFADLGEFLHRVHWGYGTPEGAVIAPITHIYFRLDGGASTILYVKETGTGDTGWVAK